MLETEAPFGNFCNMEQNTKKKKKKKLMMMDMTKKKCVDQITERKQSEQLFGLDPCIPLISFATSSK